MDGYGKDENGMAGNVIDRYGKNGNGMAGNGMP